MDFDALATPILIWLCLVGIKRHYLAQSRRSFAGYLLVKCDYYEKRSFKKKLIYFLSYISRMVLQCNKQFIAQCEFKLYHRNYINFNLFSIHPRKKTNLLSSLDGILITALYDWLNSDHYIILINWILKSNSSIFPRSEGYITQYTP